jgi:hypothetical protein
MAAFTARDKSGLVVTQHASFRAALESAARMAQGAANAGYHVPATVEDFHGCQWAVWPSGEHHLIYCPATEAGRAFECGCDGYWRLELAKGPALDPWGNSDPDLGCDAVR